MVDIVLYRYNSYLTLERVNILKKLTFAYPCGALIAAGTNQSSSGPVLLLQNFAIGLMLLSLDQREKLYSAVPSLWSSCLCRRWAGFQALVGPYLTFGFIRYWTSSQPTAKLVLLDFSCKPLG